ncbi:MAG: PQQ-binding-like beta-propeller repeat protein [Desulfatitalea sp.]|nr:PQQ-binding-like beta-propeller repeat protein [Desulfatitalea sp.]
MKMRLAAWLTMAGIALGVGGGAVALAVEISDMPLDRYGADAVAEGVVSGQVVSESGMVFQTRYWPGLWTGDVLAFAGDSFTGSVDTDPQGAVWRAAERLNEAGVTHDTRRIVTYGGIYAAPEGVPFRYDQLSEAQKAMLGSDGVRDSAADRTARDLVDYLRGLDLKRFRERAGPLGDIVHSAPVLAGRTLFVGANDGMLHAFDTRSGRERFAYVPHLVQARLKALARPDYVDHHRFFVDGTPYVGEVVEDQYQRGTYLVGGLGKGGRGYYCLRIGSRRRAWEGDGLGPYQTQFSVDAIGADAYERDIAGVVRWEYPPPAPFMDTSGGGAGDGEAAPVVVADPDMGYSFGQGYVVNANAPEGRHRPVVIFGNGYNSPNGRAVLVVIDALNGEVVRKIDTGAGGDNGLSIPALVDVTLDRQVDYVYAGDLRGNLWKFDLTADDPRRWGVAHGDDLNRDGVIDAAHGDLPKPLFQAHGQPITGRPDVMAMGGGCAPGGSGYLVVFGTGRFLGPSDRLDTRQQSIYGIWDVGQGGTPLGRLTGRRAGRLSSGRYLVRREVVTHGTRDGQAVRGLSDWMAGVAERPDRKGADRKQGITSDPPPTAGWFFDFPGAADPLKEPGERVIGPVTIRGGTAVVISFIPGRTPEQRDASWLNILHLCGPSDGPVAVRTDAMGLSRRFEGRLSQVPVVGKTEPASRVETIVLHDERGQLVQVPFWGEFRGRGFWRQDGWD